MIKTIEAICTGTARPFNGAETSAIVKRPRDGTVQVLKDGLAPDEQADLRVHGGPEKAVHLYPLDHHALWRDEIDNNLVHDMLEEPGCFGSNLAVNDLREADVFVGDRFRVGPAETGAVIEVSQPRQPCWKVDHRFGIKGMTARIVETGRSGWYFRVIEEGAVQAGDSLERIETGHADWSIARVFSALIQGKATPEELRELAKLPRLSPQIRARAVRKLG